MKNCAICSAPLKFLNTPLLGSGKLNDGNEVCTKCYGKTKATSLKKYSLSDVQDMIAGKATASDDKKIVEAAEAVAKQERKAEEQAVKAQEAVVREERKAAEQQEKKIQQEERKEQKKQESEAKMAEYKAEKNEKQERIDAIKAHIKGLPIDGISSFLGRKEINELPNILAPDEKVDHIIQGWYNNGQGILVSTNRRLVFIDKGLLYGIKVEDFPLDKITSIQYETGLLFGNVKIHTSGNTANIEQVDKKSARHFSEFVREKLSRPKEVAPIVITTTAAPAAPDVLEQLEKLGKLKAAGILSEEEFSEQKAKLLAKL